MKKENTPEKKQKNKKRLREQSKEISTLSQSVNEDVSK